MREIGILVCVAVWQDAVLHPSERAGGRSGSVRRYSVSMPGYYALRTQADEREELPGMQAQTQQAKGPDRA
eukprot:12892047-Alexandrium_andersonii.AAC.1